MWAGVYHQRMKQVLSWPEASPRESLAAGAQLGGRGVRARHVVLLCVLAGCLAACGASAAGPAPLASPGASEANEQAVRAQLTKQADAWDRAIVSKDRAAIASNMAEDFRQIDGDAHVETKASFVDGVMLEALSIDPYVNEEFEIRLYGDVALISGRTRMTGRYEGKPFASHYRYIDVYARRAGEWKVVSVQISRVKE